MGAEETDMGAEEADIDAEEPDIGAGEADVAEEVVAADELVAAVDVLLEPQAASTTASMLVTSVSPGVRFLRWREAEVALDGSSDTEDADKNGAMWLRGCICRS